MGTWGTTTKPKVIKPPKVSGWGGDWSVATPTATTTNIQAPVYQAPTYRAPTGKALIGTIPSLTAAQKAVSTPLSQYLSGAIAAATPTFTGATLPAFTGPLAEQAEGVYAEAMQDITPDMFGGVLGAEAQTAYREAMAGVAPPVFGGPLGAQTQEAYAEAIAGVAPQMFGGELSAEALGAYREALKGEFPEEYYQKSIRDPAMEEFMQDIIPAIKESYVATGAITGTEVGERIGREASKLQTGLVGVRAQLAEQAKQRSFEAARNYQQAFQMAEGAGKDRALAAAGMYQTAYQSGQEQAKQRQLMAAGNYQQAYQGAVEAAKARALTATGNYQQMQLELTKLAYDDFTRRNPAATEILQASLSYLNIPMMAAYQKP